MSDYYRCCGNLKPTDLDVGVRVHNRKTFEGMDGTTLRMGGQERYVISYISKEHVLLNIFDSRGKHIWEAHYSRSDFDAKYERCPGV